nr:hypothetical protein BaRGS_015404 [Batillaria attramentaria]
MQRKTEKSEKPLTLCEFQKFTGLPVTGTLDEETITKMRAPRCGFPDKPSNRSNPLFNDWPEAQNFVSLGTRWNKDTVTWKPLKLTRQLPERDQWQALERGFKYWSDVTPLKFRYSSGEADIDVTFANGRGIGGDTHFDDDEQWTLGTGQGSDLEIVAAHEFGHALGLGHSREPNALMAPYYRYVQDLKLHPDDVRGIQTLYESPRCQVPDQNNDHNSTDYHGNDHDHHHHDTTHHNIFHYHHHDHTETLDDYGYSYVFRYDRVYKELESGATPTSDGRRDGQFWEWDRRYEQVAPGYPLQTDVYWVGAPRHPEAATSDHNGNFYFFKGSRYFKLHNRVASGDSKRTADWFGYACGGTYRQLSDEWETTQRETDLNGFARDAGNESDDKLFGSYSVGYPEIGTHREVAPRLPFEFDLGPVASGDESERFLS